MGLRLGRHQVLVIQRRGLGGCGRRCSAAVRTRWRPIEANAASKVSVNWKKSIARRPLAWARRNVRHASLRLEGWRYPAAVQDPADGGGGDAVAEPSQLALDAKISASFHADDRDNTNHDDSRIKIKYNSRTITASDQQITR
jgi:hypothetical protein